MTRFIW